MKKLMKTSTPFLLMMIVMLFAAAMSVSAEDYNLWVGGVQVTSENAYDVLGDGKVSYDAETSTLTLDSVTIENYYDFSNPQLNKPETAVIYSKQELNILVKGICSIMTNVKNSYNDYGIYCKVPTASKGEERDALRISGYNDEAILVVSSAHTLNDTSALYTFDGDIIIENLDLTCYSASALRSNTIYANGGTINIDNSTVLCNANYAQVQSSGLIAGFGITITGASDVKFDAKTCSYYGEDETVSYGMLTLGKLIISEESTVNVRAAEINSTGIASSYGVLSGLGIEIDGGSKLESYSGYVSISSSSDSRNSVGVFAGSILVTGGSEIVGCSAYASSASIGVYGMTITVEDGKISGSSVYDVPVYSGIASDNPIQGENALICDDDLKFYLKFVPGTGGLPGYFVDETGAIPHRTVAASPMEFDIWVGGVRLTSDNCDDVFGDGSVSYDHLTRTLTLDNATITGSYVYSVSEYKTDDGNGGIIDVVKTNSAGIHSEYNITLNIVGDVVIDCSKDTATCNTGINLDSMSSSDYNSQKIIGNGDASLTVIGGGKEESCGICVDSANLLIKDITLDVKAGNTTDNSLAFYAKDADYTIEFNNIVANFAGGDVYGGAEMAAGGIGGGGYITITNKSNITASSGNVYAGEEEGSCGGFITLGLVEITDESTLNVYGGDVYSDGKQAMSFGMFVIGSVELGDNCTLNTYGGEVHLSNEPTVENAQSIGFSIVLLPITIGDNAVFNSYGSYSDGGSVGVYITDIDTSPEYNETVVFKTETGVMNAGSTNTNADAISVGIYSDNPVENGTVRDAVTGEVLSYNGGVYFDSKGNMVNYVTVNGGVVLFGDYNLVVGGIIVTKENAHDILGELDGEGSTAYYDPDTKTLTLENANITGGYDMDGSVIGIMSYGSLNIKLIGDNKVHNTSYSESSTYMSAGIAVLGKLTIDSDNYASLDVKTADALNEIYGIYVVDVTGEGKAKLDISGKVTVNVDAGSSKYTNDYAVTCGIYVLGDLSVTEHASIYSHSGIALPVEGATSYECQSIGIAVIGKTTVNTTGKVYGFGEKASNVFGGVAMLGGAEVLNGTVIGEASAEFIDGAYSAGVAVKEDIENVIIKTGTSSKELNDALWYYFDETYGGIYLYGNDEIGIYTKIISENLISDLEVRKDTEDEDGDEDTEETYISIVVTGYEGAIIAFASYEANGRMVDMTAKMENSADVNGEIHAELDLTNAVRVKAFAFENSMAARPLCDCIEIVDLAPVN